MLFDILKGKQRRVPSGARRPGPGPSRPPRSPVLPTSALAPGFLSPILYVLSSPFDLYALQEWSVREVAHALGVSAGSVYLAKHRISALLTKELKRLEKG